ncbi:MAG: hypothetical protein O3B13_15475, partial [Planctomycetota bacterium]|nr:hypothetical protein [Planctomycetota bacterium]
MSRPLKCVVVCIVCGMSVGWEVETHFTVAADAPPGRKVTAQDMPRIPHTEPVDALKSFRLANGFQLEVVATEPLVSDPVAACFDEFGCMFVAEMHGY